MSAFKRGLNRGLDQLLSASATTETPQDKNDKQITFLPLEWLQRGCYQPRKDINTETVKELADSIRAQGLIQPIIVRKIAEQRYEIVAGD
ncbi:MAG: ParB N-terminal domain-containing protein, partial [Gammaproteobacteria bacterium]|nr:ParB N-terminal domain-containing protein [Gammaproteobacteria bacterium]